MRRVLRWLVWGSLGLLGLLLLAAGGGYWWLLRSLPDLDGEVLVSWLDEPVTITRDRHGIPHIEAENFQNAIFAQGFAHAQDRLWQMEFQRRVGAGRLAEIVGEPALPTDRFMRMLGVYQLAKASLGHLSADSLAWLDAYAAGVNAFLDQRSGPLPPEFLLLGHADIEPWTPADSVVWIKMMALDLSRNWRSELLRARLAKQLSDDQIIDLWPGYANDDPITLSDLAHGLDLERLAAVLPPGPQPGMGSNAWVVSGDHSETGAPLLANDPHLGLSAPGTWYLAHLKAPELELIGAGLPGVPGIVLGHNGEIAWGMTNTGPDTQDLFVERIDPEDTDRYLIPGGSAPFTKRAEVIHVKGGDSITLTVRTTRHGPVISDLVGSASDVVDDDQILALAWTALIENDTSIETLFDLAKATEWSAFLEAVRGHDTPMQNVLYADKSGHIGFVAPGNVPIRKQGDGLWPVPGWTGSHDWVDVVSFEGLPKVFDPRNGMLLNGNNRIVPEDYPHLLTAIWEPPYRARRIETLLKDQTHNLLTFASIQSDQLSLLATDLLPLMLDMTPGTDEAAQVADELRDWDRIMDKNAAEPLIFAAWYRAFSRLAYADELGPLFLSYWNIRPLFVELILTKKPIWCDNQATEQVEQCRDLLSEALDLALSDLTARFGTNPASWQWGEAHPAKMGHPVLDGQPVIEDIFNIQVPIGGDSVTVNVGHYALWNNQHPFTSVQAASYRGLYDLDDLDRSRFIAATGQSGHPLSPHYRDLSALWAKGETVQMAREREEYSQSARGELILKPRAGMGDIFSHQATFSAFSTHFAQKPFARQSIDAN